LDFTSNRQGPEVCHFPAQADFVLLGSFKQKKKQQKAQTTTHSDNTPTPPKT